MSQAQSRRAERFTNGCQANELGATVLLSSRKTAWEGMALEHIDFRAIDISDVTATSHHLVLPQRIERSKRLLKQKDLAIVDIALMCGFKNQSHLTTLFRKSTGTTPKNFRACASG